ncbi:MAG: hypothetical protein J0I40_05575 [Cellulomonas sp.]|nr:hypothetical protein [Cellulomonas sp.]
MSLRPGSSVPTPVVSPPRVYLAREHDRNATAARVRRASWERLTRGGYGPTSPRRSREERALAVIAAVDDRLTRPHWFSHESAALVWGLPLWRVPDATHVRQLGRPGTGRDRLVARHTGPVDPGQLTVVGSLPVTSLAQTMVDCARSLPPLARHVVADAALRAGADRSSALELLARIAGRNGVARARGVIELADAGAESPGESAARFVVLRDGLPLPRTQIPVTTRLGTFWTDLGWEEWRVFLEYDGRTKYRTAEDLVAEKRRQDALVDAGCRLVRVTKEDIPRRAGLSARVLRLLPPDVPTILRPPLLR